MKFILSVGLFVAVLSVRAQGVSGTVTGEWSDGKTETLVGANVVWKDTRSGTLTNEQGKFHIGVPPGAQKLVFFYVGFQPDTIAYTGQKEINVKLRQAGSGKEIVVEGERASTYINSRDPQLFQVMNEKELCKAACCNLSESFETNASVDAAYADAITGTRQIRMLGLEGKYTQMLFDNIPSVRGLSSTYGLTYVPGPWVKNIYITKGVGSITSGYESMAGQINVALKNPDTAERFHLNAYAGSGGRTELNLVVGPKGEHEDHEEEGEHDHHQHIKGSLLAHGAMSQLRTDMNGDGFLDNPLFSNLSLRNEWHFDGHGGLGAQVAFNYQNINTISGKLNYSPTDEVRSQLWGVNTQTRRYEASAKVGYVFPNKPWKSFGSQWSALYHDQRGDYGYQSYKGEQRSGRINLLFASRILNESNTFTTGFSYVFDDYRDTLISDFPYINNNSTYALSRQERIPGVFFEYTLKVRDRFTLVAGAREDLHNKYGALFTPRMHARFSINDHMTVKAVGGMGYRTAVLVMDNVGMLASNRFIRIEGDDAATNTFYGLDIEKSRNAGLVFTWKGDLFYRPATLSVDGFITDFESQVVVDYETPGYVKFYNLNGKSFSNSAQAELQWSPVRRFDVRMAYRWLEARTQYRDGLRDRPLVNRHRAFTNLAFETRKKPNGSQWRFDATVQWISRKRIPFVISNHAEHDKEPLSTWSNDYWQVMAQVTYVFKTNLELYVGGENLTNFMVHDAIIMADETDTKWFDGSLLWGPVFGRMGYVGLRWML